VSGFHVTFRKCVEKEVVGANGSILFHEKKQEQYAGYLVICQ
jgi:hypothetical protein